MKNKAAVALLSGGLDSTVATALYHKKHGVERALFFEYGQKALSAERRASKNIADELGINWQTIKLPWLKSLLPDAMSGKSLPPEMSNKLLRDKKYCEKTAKAVWVPNRNGLFVNIAATLAEANSLGAVVVGFNKEEATTFPDNSLEFLERTNKALALSTSNGVKLLSPTLRLSKKGIVKKAIKEQLSLKHIWSCYKSGRKMCGFCESCVRLNTALACSGAARECWPSALFGGRA